MPSGMAASHHQPQQNPTRQVDGLTDRRIVIWLVAGCRRNADAAPAPVAAG
jgi:hypothetical protein